MSLHKKARTELVPPAAEMERVIGCAAHRAMQKEISEHALTLVKYKDADVLPMTPEKYRRIMIVYVTGWRPRPGRRDEKADGRRQKRSREPERKAGSQGL